MRGGDKRGYNTAAHDVKVCAPDNGKTFQSYSVDRVRPSKWLLSSSQLLAAAFM
jgi:hypothetical protein